MNTIVRLFFGFFNLTQGLFAQVEREVAAPDYIKSIIFKSQNQGDQFPIVQPGEPIFLQFDDLRATEADYYYEVVHCNYDWTVSQLLPSQYLKGVNNQRITSYQNSVNTLQPYSHYELQLPNAQTGFLLSGNYILKIYTSRDELVFSRRWVVYENRLPVAVSLKQSRNLSENLRKQVVHFTVSTGGMSLVNPQQEVKIAILKNYQWHNAITGIRPQFFSGNQLIYRYNTETAFEGDNEFLFFDTKEMRAATNAIASVQLRERYHQYLFTNLPRAGQVYTYFPDINGDFIVRTLDGEPATTHADYSWVHVSFPYQPEIGLKKVYVYGKFNNYELSEENRLQLNQQSGNLEVALLLKQGFYNYTYVLADEDEKIDVQTINGSFFETENRYLVLVYYRIFGEMYDRVIGVGTGDSTNITR
jgi:hypothetical protein